MDGHEVFFRPFCERLEEGVSYGYMVDGKVQYMSHLSACTDASLAKHFPRWMDQDPSKSLKRTLARSF